MPTSTPGATAAATQPSRSPWARLPASRSPQYTRVFALADKAGKPMPRQAMPQIDLKSPKITRKLTTEWFARRVEGRYKTCLTRGAS